MISEQFVGYFIWFYCCFIQSPTCSQVIIYFEPLNVSTDWDYGGIGNFPTDNPPKFGTCAYISQCFDIWGDSSVPGWFEKSFSFVAYTNIHFEWSSKSSHTSSHEYKVTYYPDNEPSSSFTYSMKTISETQSLYPSQLSDWDNKLNFKIRFEMNTIYSDLHTFISLLKIYGLPVANPTTSPTNHPSIYPTNQPTMNPTTNPTLTPTLNPTLAPTLNPILTPTLNQSLNPTLNPSLNRTFRPSLNPTTINEASVSYSTTNNVSIGSMNDKDKDDFSIILAIIVGVIFVLIIGCISCFLLYLKKQNITVTETNTNLSTNAMIDSGTNKTETELTAKVNLQSNELKDNAESKKENEIQNEGMKRRNSDSEVLYMSNQDGTKNTNTVGITPNNDNSGDDSESLYMSTNDTGIDNKTIGGTTKGDGIDDV